MIIARIKGGLGNQLFSYSAARALSIRTGIPLVLDDVSGFRRDPFGRSYELGPLALPVNAATPAQRLEPFGRLRRRLRRRRGRLLPFPERYYIEEESLGFDSRLLDVRPDHDVYIEGYWQSELYFKDVESRIRADLQGAAIPADRLHGQGIGAVHMRWFNHPDLRLGPSDLDPRYYRRALSAAEERWGIETWLVFSDFPEEAVALLSSLHDGEYRLPPTSGSQSAVDTLREMTRCRRFVIANSTLSWWAAWLCTAPDKGVFAPGQQINGPGTWGFDGLIPAGWMQA